MKRERMKVIVRSTLAPFAMLTTLVISFPYAGVAQQMFPSPEQASHSLFQAVQNNDFQSINRILGGRTELTSSGDELQDQAERKLFIEKYREMHRLVHEPDRSLVLYIGAENWPFPIPLVTKNGLWHFDSDAGKKEVLFRRIGENEVTAIEICREFIAAEKHDRPTSMAENPVTSLAATLLAKASSHSSAGNPTLFQGYYFRVLPKDAPTERRVAEVSSDGGFKLIAYPAAYRSSGVMTFIVTQNDIVYEKDLGARTSALATAMETFHKDVSWRETGE